MGFVSGIPECGLGCLVDYLSDGVGWEAEDRRGVEDEEAEARDEKAQGNPRVSTRIEGDEGGCCRDDEEQVLHVRLQEPGIIAR